MEKKIIKISPPQFYTAGTAKYKVEWQGEWTDEELVNYCDGGDYNYGGRIDGKRQLENGNFTGIVCVYID